MPESNGPSLRQYRVLAVDDERGFLDNLKYLMERSYSLVCVESAEAALRALQTLPAFDVVLLDLNLGSGDSDGLAVLRRVHELEPELPVIILTGSGSVERAVEAMKAGAADYLRKGDDYDDLDYRITEVIYRLQIQRENRILRRQLSESAGEMIGSGPAMQNLRRQIEVAAPGDSPVLITGETGTGKELVFRALHRQMVELASARHPDARRPAAIPLDMYNCAARPGDEFRMTLFGSEDKRFANMAAMPGKFEDIGIGVLLLDEISKISRDLQAQILRVVENRTFSRVGSNRECLFRGRIVAATNCDPQQAIADGTLLEDLYYRLCACEIRVPPLRARTEDIPALARYFVAETCRETALPPVTLTPAELTHLAACSWPGNVRQLKHVISQFVRASALDRAEGPPDLRALLNGGRGASHEDRGSGFEDLIGLPWKLAKSVLTRRLAAFMIPRVLQAHDGNRAQAADSLGMTRYGLDKLIEKLENPPTPEAEGPQASD